MMNNVCTKTVATDLCIGCGVCAGICPAKNLSMQWTDAGQYHPVDAGHCLEKCHHCLDVCPFQNHDENEDTLAATSFGKISDIHHTPETGYYLQNYVGYAHDGYRERGASGGIASWVLAALLEQKIVDHIICVRPNADPDKLFSYAVLSSVADIQHSAKSAYYPVELSEVIQQVLDVDARYAVIGLPCFLKALRLAMLADARLRDRVVATIGLTCGHLKSKGFAQTIALKMGVESPVEAVVFRDKYFDQPATEYDVSVIGADGLKRSALMSEIMPEAWVAGVFKLRPCEFCDDIFAEVADISLMDAWLPEYTADGRGISIAIVRSEKMRELLVGGITEDELSLQPLPIDKVIANHAGVVYNKRALLANKLAIAEPGSAPVKRVLPVEPTERVRRILIIQGKIHQACLSTLPAIMANRLESYQDKVAPLLVELAEAQRIPMIVRMISAVRRRIDRVKNMVMRG